MQILNRVVCSYLSRFRLGRTPIPPMEALAEFVEKRKESAGLSPLNFDGVAYLGCAEVGAIELWSHRCSHYRWRPSGTGASARGA